MPSEVKSNGISWSAALPAYAGYLFLIAPSLVIIPMSFGNSTDLQFPPHAFSLELYRQFFFDSTWVETTVQSLIVALATMAVSLVLGVSAAYGLVRFNFPMKSVVAIFLLSPILTPVIVIALGLYLYFGKLGLNGSTLGLVLGHTLHATPFVLIVSMSGLKHVDTNLELAGRVMGAGALEVIRKITIPLLFPTVVAAALFAFLMSFDEVVISYFISSIQTQTLPVKMYSSIQWEISPVLAAISSLLTFLSLIICALVSRLYRDESKGQ